MVLGLSKYLKKLNPDTYEYFDTPDGEDCLRKMLFMTKYATLAGVVVSAYDIAFYSHPKGYAQMAFRMGYWILPLATMGATYSAITCLSTRVREKDDHINHAIGGAVAGYVWGTFRSTLAGGFRVGAFLAVAGMVWKEHVIKGYELFPVPLQRAASVFRKPEYDFSLYREPKDSDVNKVKECE